MFSNFFPKRKIIAAAVALILIIVFLIPSIAKGSSSETDAANELPSVKVKSKYAVVMDADSGNILYNKGGDETIYPASTSKILTCIVAIENSEMDDIVTVSQSALKGQENNGAHIGLKAGEKLTMKDALYGMMLESANDAAIAIAESISGSEEEFAKLLNEKAEELGLDNSHFVTPNGLFDEEHYTTAKDLAIITKYAMENEKFLKIFSAYKYIMSPTNMRSDKLDIYTSHKMTKYKSMEYDGIIGGKTGYIEESKCNVVTAAERNGIKLICVTAKCDNIIDAYNDSTKLLDSSFENYSKVKISASENQDKFEDMLKSSNYKIKHSSISDEDLSAVIPKDADISKITYKIKEEKASYPIKKGAVTGKLQMLYDGNIVGTANIIADKDLSFWGYTMSVAVKVILAIAILLIITIVVLRIYFTFKRKRKKISRR